MPDRRAISIVEAILAAHPEAGGPKDNVWHLFCLAAPIRFPGIFRRSKSGAVFNLSEHRFFIFYMSVRRYRRMLRGKYPSSKDVEKELQRRAEAHREIFSPASHP